MLKKILILSLIIFIIALINNNFDNIAWKTNEWRKETNEEFLTNSFKENFESYKTFDDLLKKDLSAWHWFEKAYSGNKIEVTTEEYSSGSKSLKMYANKYDWKDASKASMKRYWFGFRSWDEVWFTASYYLKWWNDNKYLFLFDLEDDKIKLLWKRQSPWRRVLIWPNKEIISDLGKWFKKDNFYQEKSKEIIFPTDRWVNIKVHMTLDTKNWLMQIWQDDKKILERRWITIPRDDIIYNTFEVWITANGNMDSSHILYIDDIEISDKKIF